jgi:solute carrier family 25 protein 34/35
LIALANVALPPSPFQPFDLVAARMMNQPVDPTTGKGRYSGPIDCLKKTVQTEGPLGLYKGVTANFMRMAPQYILTFMFFEQLMELTSPKPK